MLPLFLFTCIVVAVKHYLDSILTNDFLCSSSSVRLCSAVQPHESEEDEDEREVCEGRSLGIHVRECLRKGSCYCNRGGGGR